MKICFLNNRWDYGGVPNYIRNFALELSKKHEVGIIVQDQEIDIDNIYAPTIKPIDSYSTIFKIARKIKGKKFDIIHVNSVLELAAAQASSSPKVWSLHGFDHTCPLGSYYKKNEIEICNSIRCWECTGSLWIIEKLKGFARRQISKKADVYLANSGYVKEIFERHYNKKAEVLHPGLDLSKYENKSDEDYVLFVNRLYKYKGTEHLIKVMNELEYECKIVGDGPEKSKLERMANNNIQFLGELSPVESPNGSKLEELYAKASLVVVPSIFPEPFGMTCVEALASEKPVIASKTGGIIDVINENNGILVEPKNVEQLKDAITTLMNNSSLRKELGRNGRKFVEENFNVEIQTKKLERMYYDLLM